MYSVFDGFGSSLVF